MSTVTFGGVDYRIVSSNAVCYAGTTGCGSTIFGWYLPLTYGAANPADVNSPLQLSSSTNPPVYEQVIFNPIVDGDTFIVNTVIPSASSLTNCFSASAGGFTMAIDPGSGGSFPKSVFVPPATAAPTPPDLNGIALNGTGSVFLVTTNPTCTGANCGGGCVGAGCAPACVGAACGTPPPCTPGVNNFIITQTESAKPTATQANLQCNLNGSRLTWIQRR
jgi:type IV pilus assembly protein PilY1